MKRHGERRSQRFAGPVLAFAFTVLALTGVSAQQRQPQDQRSAQPDEEVLGIVVPTERQQERQDRQLLSVTQQNYPVTPGDVYRLEYRAANGQVSRQVAVESDYTLNLDVFGKLRTKGLSFSQLKTQVEGVVSRAFPGSSPFMTIESVGLFQVIVTGEVPQTTFVSAWGLSRLSDVVEGLLGPFSSTRAVGIRSEDGQLETYDLFIAQHLGNLEQNPLVKPGDTVVVYRRGREVEITGEVFRPGSYQLTPGEDLEDLVEVYARGFTDKAETSRIKVERVSGEPKAFLVDFSQPRSERTPLEDGDVVEVAARSAYLPIVIIEGALLAPEQEEETLLFDQSGDRVLPPPVNYNRITYTFKDGETIYDAVNAVRERISPLAELRNSFVVRQSAGDPLSVDLQAVLYGPRPERDGSVQLEPFDRIILPFRQFSIAVSGAVPAPGNYPYLPNRSHLYYVGMAGGFDQDRNARGKVTIIDYQGDKRKSGEVIQPGDQIRVHSNSFVYRFNRYFPVIASSLTLATAVLTLVQLTN